MGVRPGEVWEGERRGGRGGGKGEEAGEREGTSKDPGGAGRRGEEERRGVKHKEEACVL